MAPRYKFSEGEIKAIEQRRREYKDKRTKIRLKAIELRAKRAAAKEVSEATGFHAAYVTRLVAKYWEHGLDAISGNHYGGNHRNVSVEEEANILAPFKARVEKGKLVEISKIARAYQSVVDAYFYVLSLCCSGLLLPVKQGTCRLLYADGRPFCCLNNFYALSTIWGSLHRLLIPLCQLGNFGREN